MFSQIRYFAVHGLLILCSVCQPAVCNLAVDAFLTKSAHYSRNSVAPLRFFDHVSYVERSRAKRVAGKFCVAYGPLFALSSPTFIRDCPAARPAARGGRSIRVKSSLMHLEELRMPNETEL
jgi:hypothetical protein